MVAGGEGTGHGDRLQHERQDRSRCQRRQPSPCEVRGGVLAGPTARVAFASLPLARQDRPGIRRGPGGGAEPDRVEKSLSDFQTRLRVLPTVSSAEGRD